MECISSPNLRHIAHSMLCTALKCGRKRRTAIKRAEHGDASPHTTSGSLSAAPTDDAPAATPTAEPHHHHHTRSASSAESFGTASSAPAVTTLANAFTLPLGATGEHLRDASAADLERLLAFSRETSGGAVASVDAVRRLRERAVVAEVQVIPSSRGDACYCWLHRTQTLPTGSALSHACTPCLRTCLQPWWIRSGYAHSMWAQAAFGICSHDTDGNAEERRRGAGAVQLWNNRRPLLKAECVQGHIDAALALYKERGAAPCGVALKLKAARYQACVLLSDCWVASV